MAEILNRKTSLGKQAGTAGLLLALWLLLLAASLLLFKGGQSYWALSLFFVFLFLSSPAWRLLASIRGYLGENRVSRELESLPEGYSILNDLRLTAGKNPAQIDHVVVSPSGIWCVETKSHLGRIFGKEEEKEWTQVKFSERGRRYTKKFYNPILQNRTHCRRLEEYLKQVLSFPLPPIRHDQGQALPF